ncbi:hypothetical protein I8F73_04320 [Enterococcus faecalis]|nr:hypothetical protein [Enterococcus faecalis]
MKVQSFKPAAWRRHYRSLPGLDYALPGKITVVDFLGQDTRNLSSIIGILAAAVGIGSVIQLSSARKTAEIREHLSLKLHKISGRVVSRS